MLPDIFTGLEHEGDGYFQIKSFVKEGGDAYVNIEVHPDVEISQNWQMKVLDYRRFVIDNRWEPITYINIFEDHFLLKEHKEPSTELYFTKSPKDELKFMVDVYALHLKEFENLMPTDYFINAFWLRLGSKGAGLFAKGPKSILKCYFELMKSQAMNPHFVGSHELTYWNGKARVTDRRDVKIAFLGDSYFIGTDIQFEKVDGSDITI